MPRTSAPDQRLPAQLGEFEIEGLLGEGGSGTVYAARWGRREVALKVLRMALLPSDRERKQFQQEAQLLSGIEHPAVVRVLTAGELPDGRPYLAMERLVGTSLATRLDRGALPLAEALSIFEQLAAAVGVLHDQGLIHRDIKPENVYLQPDGAAVLLDFGIAKPVDALPSTVTREGGVRGTPAYMAPERFFGTRASESTDIYELAVVLYVMVCGRLPWDDATETTSRLNPTRPSAVDVVLPGDMEEVLLTALASRAESRPATVANLVGQLRQAQHAEPAGNRRTVDLHGPAAPPSGPDPDPITGPVTGGPAIAYDQTVALETPPSATPPSAPAAITPGPEIAHDQTVALGTAPPAQPGQWPAPPGPAGQWPTPQTWPTPSAPPRKSRVGLFFLIGVPIAMAALVLGLLVVLYVLEMRNLEKGQDADRAGNLTDHRSLGTLPQPAPPVWPEPASRGPAYFATEGRGLVRLEAGQFRSVPGTPETISQIVAGPKGHLWLRTSAGLRRWDGGRMHKVDTATAAFSTADHLAVGPKGELWVWATRGLHHFDGSLWRRIGQPGTLSKIKGGIASLLVDRRGQVWVIEHENIAGKSGGRWLHVRTFKGKSGFYVSGGRLSPTGELLVRTTMGVLRLKGRQWQRVGLGTQRIDAVHLAAGPKRSLHIASYNKVRVVRLGKGTVREHKAGKHFQAHSLDALAADGQGRTWLAADHGLVVLGGARAPVQWKLGTVPALGVPIKAIYVRGRGPNLPPAGPVQTATVAGRLIHEGKGVANVPVLLCMEVLIMAAEIRGKPPCTDQAIQHATKTDAQGRFRFNEVPLIRYELAYHAARRWHQAPTEQCCKNLRPGQTNDLGVIKMRRK